MNTIKQIKTEKAEIPQEPINSDTRRSPGILDQHYIELYLDKPQVSKVERYRQACKAAETKPPKYVHQAAADLHNRLQSEIERQVLTLNLDDKVLGRSVIRELVTNATSESVRGQMAVTLAKGLYPDVKAVEPKSLADIDAELAILEQEIRH